MRTQPWGEKHPAHAGATLRGAVVQLMDAAMEGEKHPAHAGATLREAISQLRPPAENVAVWGSIFSLRTGDARVGLPEKNTLADQVFAERGSSLR